MSYVCDENSVPYYEGIYEALGECIHKDDAAKMVSFVFGWCSIGCWVFAQIPQVVKSIILKNVESVSVFLFINWFIGDLSNLLGCIFTKSLVTQLASGVYYMFIDSVCITVNLYFRYCYKPKDVTDKLTGGIMDGSSGDSGSDNKNDSAEANGLEMSKETNSENETEQTQNRAAWPNSRMQLTTTVLFFLLRSGMAFAPAKKTIGKWISFYSFLGDVKDPGLFLLGEEEGGEESFEEEEEEGDYTDSPLYIAGCVLGYISCVMYLAARLPQIVKNARQHNVAGLAPAMFALAAAANTFYALSIVLGTKTTEEFIKQIPWLLGSAGTLVFDATLLIQYFHYKKKAKYILVSVAATEENSLVSESSPQQSQS